MTTAELTRAVLDLPVYEREQLVDVLIASLDGEEDQATVDRAWRAEIARRVADLRAGLVETFSWDEMNQRLDERRMARAQ